jgi:putative phage-type endonuclease
MSGEKAKVYTNKKTCATAAKTLKSKYGIDCKVVGHEDEMTRDEWLVHRQAGIGGSEIAAVRGLSKFQSPLTLYREKMGITPGMEDNDLLYFGRALEGFIADEGKLRLQDADPDVQVINMKFILERDVDGFPARANTDRLVCLNGKWGIMECKNVNEYVKGDWDGDKVPIYYEEQGQWYLYVTGLPFVIFVAMLGGRQITAKMMVRDETRIAEMAKAGKEFWTTNIVGRVAPEVSDPKDIAAVCEDLGPKEEYPDIADAGEHLALTQHCKMWNLAKADEKEAKSRKEVMKAKIIQGLTAIKCFRIDEDGGKLAGLSFTKGRKVQDKDKLANASEEELETFNSFYKEGEPSVGLR